MPDIELNEYEINPNTIKYHSRTKRFFRAFTPKIVGTSSALAVSGAALAAAIGGVFTGGVLPIVVGVASSATAAVSAAATISLGVDAATVSRARYKNQGVEGAKVIVEKMESEAFELVQKLEQLTQSGEKTIQLKDGYHYNARQIKSLIAGYEKTAYQGVKYLMAQAEKNTKEIEKLRKAGKLSPSQKETKEKLWDELGLIGECVRNITSKRNDVNPYKNVIIKALHKGCLIGANDSENKEIRDNKRLKQMNFTEELYHNMYEKVLLTANPPKSVATPAPEPAATPDPKPEPKEAKRSFGQRIIRKLISMTKEGKRLIAEEEEAERLRDENDILHESYKSVVDNLDHQKGLTSRYKTEADNLKAQVETLEQDVAGAKAEANKYKKGYERNVKRAFGNRGEARYFREGMEKAEDNLANNIMANLEERKKMEQELENAQNSEKEQADLAEELFNYGVGLENDREKVQEERDYAQGVAFEESERANSAESKLANVESKIADLENHRLRLIQVLIETNGMLDKALQDGKSSDELLEELLEEGIRYENEIESTKKALATEIETREKLVADINDLNGQLDKEVRSKNEAKTIIARQDAKIGALQDELSAEKDARIEAEKNSKVANETVTSLTASQENVKSKLSQVESDLDDEKLLREQAEQEKGYWQTRAEDAEDTVKAVYGTAEALEKSVAKIQEELDSIYSDKTKNLEKANMARQIKATARKIAEVWNHVKITQNEDAKKFEESTSVVIQALDKAVDRYITAKECGDMETVKQVRDELQAVYDTQRRVDSEHTWPPYIKDTKKVIPGTPIPNSPQDENYYLK